MHEEAQYFIPQIETKIMNEGWATYWHKRILDSLELPQELQLEFIVRHNQVVRPIPGRPQSVPHRLARLGGHLSPPLRAPTPEEAEARRRHRTRAATQKIFEVREADRDSLVPAPASDRRPDARAAPVRVRGQGRRSGGQQGRGRGGLAQVKETLIKNVGMGGIPVIRVEDADYGQNRTLYLVHAHEGRDLQLEYAEKTLAYMAASGNARSCSKPRSGQALAALLQRARLLDARAEVTNPFPLAPR